MCTNIVHPDRPQTIMCRACCVPKATDTHSYYEILTYFPLQEFLLLGASILRCSYNAPLVYLPIRFRNRSRHPLYKYRQVLRKLTFGFRSIFYAAYRHQNVFNLQEPCVLHIGRAHRYPPNTSFYIFFQQIYVLNILNMLHTLRFFLFKMPFIS